MRRRILGAIDLAIDFATLGEYGLEPVPAGASEPTDESCREQAGLRAGWEVFARTRRGSCTGDGRRRSDQGGHRSAARASRG